MKELKKMSKEELEALLYEVQEELARRQSNKVRIELYYNRYKGSGKCWVARVNDNKKIIGFVEPETVERDGYKGSKLFLLGDGKYLICQEGSKSRDYRKYIVVKNGKKEDWSNE